jgi:hypothetical protein
MQSVPIKLFTVHAQLCGKQLLYGSTSLYITDIGYYKDGLKGYFTIELTPVGFVIVDFVPEC